MEHSQSLAASPSHAAVLGALGELAEGLTTNPAILPNVEAKLGQLRQSVPEFPHHLCLVLVAPDGYTRHAKNIRHAAAFVLKVTLSSGHGVQDGWIRSQLVYGLRDTEPAVHSSCSLCISAVLAACGGLVAWPELLPGLIEILSGGDGVHGALISLRNIADDHGTSPECRRVLAPTIPILLALLPTETSGALGLLEVIYEFPEEDTGVVATAQRDNAHQYVSALEGLIGHPAVGTAVARALSQSVDHWGTVPSAVQCTVLSRSLQRLATSPPAESSYWLDLWGEVTGCQENKAVEAALPSLLPELLRCAKYTPEALATDDTLVTTSDAHIPDKETDLLLSEFQREREGEDDDDDEGEAKGGHGGGSQLRSAAMRCIFVLSDEYGNTVCDLLLPMLEKAVRSSDWSERESAVLLLGCAVEDRVEYFRSSGRLEAIVAFLSEMAQREENALVRDTVIWCLGQVAEGCLDEDDDDSEEGGSSSPFVANLVQHILPHIRDGNKRCQTTTITCLATIGKKCPGLAADIACALVDATPSLQLVNRCKAYERAGSIIHSLSDVAEDRASHVLKLLIARLQHLSAQPSPLKSLELPLVLSALRGVVDKAVTGMNAVAADLAKVCADVVKGVAGAAAMAVDVGLEAAVEAIDLYAALFECVGEGFLQTVRSQKVLHDAMMITMAYVQNKIGGEAASTTRDLLMHSCAALLGDMTTKAWDVVVEMGIVGIVSFLAEVSAGDACQWQPAGQLARSNAMWALGEIAVRCDASFLAPCLPHVVAFCSRTFVEHGRSMISEMLVQPTSESREGLHQNMAVLLGRLALVDPTTAGKACELHPDGMVPWVCAVRHLEDGDERNHAVAGMASLIDGTTAPHPALLMWYLQGLAPLSALPASVKLFVQKHSDAIHRCLVPSDDTLHPVLLIFHALDSTCRGRLKFPDVSALQPITEKDWGLLCKKLQASPSAGLLPRHLATLYSNGIRSLPADLTSALQKITSHLQALMT